MATQVDIPFQGWSFSGQDQSKEAGTGLVQEMLDHGSISFGRYAIEPLSWEKHSVFSHDTRQEELDKLTHPGLVAQKKAYFEEYYKKIRALKALEENKPTEIQSSHEISTEHIEINPKIDQMRECKVNASISSVPEVAVQNELHEKTGKANPLQLILRSTTNRIEHEKKSTLDSDNLSTSCETEVAVEKDVNQSGIINTLQLVPRKSVDKVEHEKKLKRDFDSLNKDWVNLKKGMTPIGGKERGESKIDNKRGKLTLAVTKSFGAVQDTTISKQKGYNPQIKSFKDSKQPTQKVNSGDTKGRRFSKLSVGGRVACNSRPNSLPSHNRPLTRSKTSLPSMNEASRVRSRSMEKSASSPSLSKGKNTRRSSLDSLLKPTASSNARSIKSEVKRNNGVLKKPLPSCVPKVLKRDAPVTVLPKRRSINVLAQDKPRPRTRSDMALKTPLHAKKTKEAKLASVGKKQLKPRKALDSNTRSKKSVAPRKKASPNYKRTKPNEDSPIKKKKRHEKPPWR